MNAFPHWVHHSAHASQSGHAPLTDLAAAGSRKAEPKLRASCDGCYTAKLKCSKERPTCPRCRDLGLICHYSPTQRTGKPRATRTQTQPQLLYLSHLPQPSQVTQASGWTLNGTANKAQSIATTKPHTQSVTEANHPQVLEHPSSTRSESSFSDRSTSAITSAALDEDLLAQWPEYLPTPEEGSLHGFSNGFMDPTNDSTRSAATHELFPRLNQAAGLKGCDCFYSLVQALHTIQAQSQCPSMNSLDIILNDSKDMISRGENMLNCTCSEDGALVMLLAGLIAKHLAFFQPASGTSASSMSASTFSENVPSCASRVTIGKYIMDGEDEQRLRIEIILMELQKLSNLILKYRGKFSSLSVGYESQTYETVFNFLYTRLGETQSRLEEQKQKSKEDR